MKKKELGNLGETKAKLFLIEKGLQFLYQNYYTKRGELDLVFLDPNNILRIIEVKTRSKKRDIENALSFQKSKNLYAAAEIFLERENLTFQEMQFDVVFIIIDRGAVVEIEHRPNFF